jgi:hypothetical protein
MRSLDRVAVHHSLHTANRVHWPGDAVTWQGEWSTDLTAADRPRDRLGLRHDVPTTPGLEIDAPQMSLGVN